jgi:two-component system sensor histidine kinase AlgZ
VWLAFAVLQAALMQWVRPFARGWTAALVYYSALALLWAALTPVVVIWQRWISSRTGHVAWRIALHLPLVGIAALLEAAVLRAMLRATGNTVVVGFPVTLIYYADLVAVSYVVIVLVTEALLAHQALARRTRHTVRLETQLARARLDYLDAQLQPHFLFNSLGAVSELAYESPAAARRMLDHINSLFRFALSSDDDEITLGRELLALEPYLDIQRVRFADWLTIEQDIEERATDCLVPRLVLQPLVENAVRHGLAGRVAAGTIQIHARVAGDRLVIRVHDNGDGLRESSSGTGRGIGLANLRERLETLYGNGEHLKLSSDEPGTTAELALPVRHADPIASSRDDASESEEDRGATVSPRSNPDRPYSLGAILLTWLACGALWTQQSLGYLWIRGRAPDSVWSVVRNDLTSACLWAVITVLIFEVTARLPLTSRRPWAGVVGYTLASLAIAFGHVVALRALTSSTIPLVSQAWTFSFALDVLIVWTLVALGHRRRLLSWLHEREVTAATLSTAVSQTRVRAARVRGDPAVLVTTLDRLRGLVATNPAATERVLMRLADYLRASLDAEGGSERRETREDALDRLRTELDAGFLAPHQPHVA